MSKLGYIKESYGKSFAAAVANTYSFNVLSNSENLPTNTLIIASNVDDDGYDTGSYSLIVTDNYGTPIRLTYTISEGNGLYYSDEEDAISLNIDNDTIIYSYSGLKFNIDNHLSNLIKKEENKIYVDEENLPTASFKVLGTAKIDNETIKIHDDSIFVDTSALRYSNNDTGEYGIMIGDNNTIKIENGVLKLNLDSINKAGEEQYGFVTSDNYTINIENGEASVVTENLELATEDEYGIVKPDGKTMYVDSEGKLTVNENMLAIATPDNYGVSRVNENSFDINDNILSVKNYDYILQSIDEYKEIYNKYKTKLEGYIDYLSDGNILLKNKRIILFAINETSTIELDRPQENEEVINMPEQYVSAVFDIITTCDFILNINFEEGTNEFPTVDLFEVNYNNETIYSKVEALNPDTVYPSTKGELKKFTIKFLAKNYRNTVRNPYIVTSVNLIISNSEDHNKYLSQKYSIFRYNSLYKEEEQQAAPEEYYILIEDSVRWSFPLSE